MSVLDDNRLIEATLRGDVDAFVVLVERYQRPLYNAARRITARVGGKPMRCPRLVVTLLVTCTSVAAFGADAGSRVSGEWPQWRGPGRDSTAATLDVPATWPSRLHEVWATEVGNSDAGPVKLVLEVGGGGNGALLAVDPATGEDVCRL